MSPTDAGRHFQPCLCDCAQRVDDALNSPCPTTRASGRQGGGQLHRAGIFPAVHHLQRMEHWHPDVSIEVFEQERQAIELLACSTAGRRCPDRQPHPPRYRLGNSLHLNAACGCAQPSPIVQRGAVSLADGPASRTSCSPSTRPNTAPCATGTGRKRPRWYGCAPARWRRAQHGRQRQRAWRSQVGPGCIGPGPWKASASKP